MMVDDALAELFGIRGLGDLPADLILGMYETMRRCGLTLSLVVWRSPPCVAKPQPLRSNASQRRKLCTN